MSDLQEQSFPRWLYWLTPTVAALATLAVVEGALAIFHPIPFASEANMYYEADPHTGFRLKPNSIGRFSNGILATVNRHGHRDDDVSIEKASGTLRILVLGDSFTMGTSAADDEVYTEVLEVLLQERLESPVEVINAGVGAWDPVHYALYYAHYGRHFDPDLVIIGFFIGNDAYSQLTETDQLRTAKFGRRVSRETVEGSSGPLGLKVFLYTRSHLARLVFNRGRFAPRKEDLRASSDETRDSQEFTPEYLAIQKQRMKRIHRRRSPASRELLANCVRQITKIKLMAEETSTPVLLLMIPDENQVNRSLGEAAMDGLKPANYDRSMPQPVLREMFREEGIEVLDLLPVFLADPSRLYLNDTHWTPAGHRLAAESLADRLLPRLTARVNPAP